MRSEPERQKSRKFFRPPRSVGAAASDLAMLHGMVMAIGTAFGFARRTNPHFRRALAASDATYLFRAGSATRRLIIEDGRVRTRRGKCEQPDYEFGFIDLRGALRHMSKEPGNVFQLLVENRIQQRGNTSHLFRFGYLATLCEKHIRKLLKKLPRA